LLSTYLVLSNEIGEPLPHFHDVWLWIVLKAHGINRDVRETEAQGLSAESKEGCHKINLRWHDLRHE
jgi:hypothetical protein